MNYRRKRQIEKLIGLAGDETFSATSWDLRQQLYLVFLSLPTEDHKRETSWEVRRQVRRWAN